MRQEHLHTGRALDWVVDAVVERDARMGGQLVRGAAACERAEPRERQHPVRAGVAPFARGRDGMLVMAAERSLVEISAELDGEAA